MSTNPTTKTSPRTSSAFKRPHWSYSQLSQFMRCPLQFYFERVAKLPRTFIPSGMALGSAIHEGLANYHRQLQAEQETAPNEVKEAFRQAWQTGEAERPIQYREGETATEIVEQGIVLLETYMAEPPPQNILAVEQPMIVPLHNSSGEFLDKPLVAILDLLSREPELGLTVTEYKASGRRYNEFEADTTLQASCYAHAVQERYDEPVSIRYTVLIKTKKPAIQRLQTARSESDLGRLGDIVQGVERAIDAKAFYPIESPMNCSGCPYRMQCRDWQGQRDLVQIQPATRINEPEAASC